MAKDGLDARQRCVLYLMLLLDERADDGWLQWTLIDSCFDDVLIQPRKTLDLALADLAEQDYIYLQTLRGSGVILVVRLTPKGREVAEKVNMLRVMPYINHKAVRRHLIV